MTVAEREVVSVHESAEALRRLSDADLRRLERLARFRVIGLDELDWQDLLNEAVVRLLSGSRRWPRDVPLIVFLRETMRSIASDCWRRREAPVVLSESDMPSTQDGESDGCVENAADVTLHPERRATASQTLAQIEELFRDDLDAGAVISGMACGKSPREIQEETDMNPTRYASTQRRIRRALARAFPDRGELP